MKYIKILSLTLLTIAFYAQGIFSENFVYVWSGHITAIFTVVYGYVKIISSKDFSLTSTGRKVYGIFDLLFTMGLFYFLFYISYFERYSATESFLLITAIMLIIVGKLIYYYKKEFSSQLVNDQ